MRTYVLLCLLAHFWITPVFALPVNFDLTVLNDDYRYQFADLVLQVSAYADGADSFRITRTADGLGVFSGTSDNGQLENSGPDEFLQFAFSKVVQLQQVVFNLVDADDEFVLAVDRSAVSDRIKIWTDTSIALVDKIFRYDFAVEGSLFQFGTWDSQDKFRISGLTVEVPESLPVPTPEPSTWMLLSAGLGGLMYWRRRI